MQNSLTAQSSSTVAVKKIRTETVVRQRRIARRHSIRNPSCRRSAWILLIATAVTFCTANSASAGDAVIGFTEPVRTIELAAAETGILTKLDVERGDTVSGGQILGTLDIDVLLSRRELAQARIDSQAKLRSARIKLTRAENNYAQFQQLRSEGHGGKRELELAASDLELARADIEAVEDESRLNRLDLKRIDAEISRRKIVSPITGVITEVHREIGEFVATTDPTVVAIADLSKLRIRFYPHTAIAESLQTGNTATVRFEHSGKTFKAEIEFIAPIIDADSNTIQVDVLLDNSKGLLRSGRRCTLLTQQTPSRTNSVTLRPRLNMSATQQNGRRQ